MRHTAWAFGSLFGDRLPAKQIPEWPWPANANTDNQHHAKIRAMEDQIWTHAYALSGEHWRFKPMTGSGELTRVIFW